VDQNIYCCFYCSRSARPLVPSCRQQWAEVLVIVITKQQNWWRRRHLWQQWSSVVVGGTFRTAHQRQSSGLERFIVVDFKQHTTCTYCWDNDVVTVRLYETVWFHRGQVSQQKHQHLYWHTTNSLRLMLKPTCHCTHVSSTNSCKLPHLTQRSIYY